VYTSDPPGLVVDIDVDVFAVVVCVEGRAVDVRQSQIAAAAVHRAAQARDV
jgi:hypothetical protein